MNKEKISKFIPIEHKNNIAEIDYSFYFQNGYKTLFFDLDNTIADYDTITPNDEIKTLFNDLKKIGFNIIILSNNKGKRVEVFSKELGVKAYSSLMKPFLFRLKKHMELDTLNSNSIIWVGDQIVTDVRCASKLNIKCIYVDALNKNSEKWYTRIFNRNIEKIRLNQIKKYNKEEYDRLKLGD